MAMESWDSCSFSSHMHAPPLGPSSRRRKVRCPGSPMASALTDATRPKSCLAFGMMLYIILRRSWDGKSKGPLAGPFATAGD